MAHWDRAEAETREACDTFSTSMLKDFGEMQGDELIPLKAPLNYILDIWSCAHHCIKANHLFSQGLWPTLGQPSPTATPLYSALLSGAGIWDHCPTKQCSVTILYISRERNLNGSSMYYLQWNLHSKHLLWSLKSSQDSWKSLLPVYHQPWKANEKITNLKLILCRPTG